MNIKVVKDKDEGFRLAKKTLYGYCDNQTVLFLSGGNTPKPLYKALAKEKKLKVGAVAMVDDRYSLHQQYSNEFMMRESGLAPYLESKDIEFYSILKFGLSREQTAREYEQNVKLLLSRFKKKVAVLGIGSDGHTAGILPGTKLLGDSLVADFNTRGEEFKGRITLTFKALSEFDRLVVLAFGKEKKNALMQMLAKEPTQKIPARFLVMDKTLLITDQKI